MSASGACAQRDNLTAKGQPPSAQLLPCLPLACEGRPAHSGTSVSPLHTLLPGPVVGGSYGLITNVTPLPSLMWGVFTDYASLLFLASKACIQRWMPNLCNSMLDMLATVLLLGGS
eukprot:scaffold210115_cov21-Tisochrysis_lutea.AAC.2